MFSCEFWEISKNTFFTEHLRMTASVSGLAQFLVTENPLKIMKNAFYFTFRLFQLFSFPRYLNFCSDFFVHVERRFDKKAKVNLKLYDVTN